MNTQINNDTDSNQMPHKNGSSIKAIIYGLLIDLGCSAAFSIVLTIAYIIWLITHGVAPDEIDEKMQSMEHWSPINIIGTLAGCGFSSLGGYVCASKSITNIDRDVLILSGLSTFAGIAVGFKTFSLLELAFLAALTVASVLLGAKFWKKTHANV